MSQSESSTDSTITVPAYVEGAMMSIGQEEEEVNEEVGYNHHQVSAIIVPLDDYRDLLTALVDAKDALDVALGKMLQYHTTSLHGTMNY